jgi:hypothetical protein
VSRSRSIFWSAPATNKLLQLEDPESQSPPYTRSTSCSQSTAQSYTTTIPLYWSAEQLRDGPVEHVDPAQTVHRSSRLSIEPRACYRTKSGLPFGELAARPSSEYR